MHVKVLLNYKNIKIQFANIFTYFQDTPIKKLIKKRMLKSKNVNVELATAFKFTKLMNSGGIALDLDFIVTKSLDSLPNNCACTGNSTTNLISQAFIKVGKKKGRFFVGRIVK